MKRLCQGSISIATLITSELFDALYDALNALDLRVKAKIELEGICADFRAVHEDDEDPEIESELFQNLCDWAEEYVPDGHYLGMSEGDGAAFGVWPIEEDHP